MKIVSGSRVLKTLLAKEYRERLRPRPMRPDMRHLMRTKKRIFQMKMKLAASKKSSDWSLKNLAVALSKLKNNKSRDFEGLANEIFKENVIGTNLKKCLLIMLNNLKNKI